MPLRHLLRLLACALALPAAGAAARPLAAQDSLRLALPDVVRQVLRSSDETRIADALVELADAQVTAARAAGLPQLRLNSTYTQVLKNARAEIVGQLFGQNYVYNSNLQLQQSLFQGGRILAAAQAASRVERAALATRDETRAQLAVLVQRVYLNALFSARLVDIQRGNLTIADERVTQVEQLERSGRASRYDVLRARVERANLEPLLRQAESDRAVADLELRRLLDLPADQPIALATELDAETVRSLAAAAVANDRVPGTRPAVAAAEYTVSARRASIRAARADLLPTFNASVSFGYLALPSANGFPTVFGDRASSYCPAGSDPTRICQNNGWFPDRNIGFQFSWPLFDGLRAKGQIDLAQAQTKTAEAQLKQARENAAIDVARARAELERARSVAAARETTVREAEEAFALARLRAERGVGTQLEVSDAQLALLTARSTDARALIDLFLAVADLARVRAEPIPLPDGASITLRESR
ncbi:MAG: TolC family protein [Gemmatimonadaceae bacterium]|nr:TolC family protein [Gemmatimonadaceae bacterium]